MVFGSKQALNPNAADGFASREEVSDVIAQCVFCGECTVDLLSLQLALAHRWVHLQVQGRLHHMSHYSSTRRDCAAGRYMAGHELKTCGSNTRNLQIRIRRLPENIDYQLMQALGASQENATWQVIDSQFQMLWQISLKICCLILDSRRSHESYRLVRSGLPRYGLPASFVTIAQ